MKVKSFTAAATLALLQATHVHAQSSSEYVDIRHGTARGWPPAIVEAGVTLVGQKATDGRVDPGGTASLDLVLALEQGPGHWSIYVEGNDTPDASGVAGLLPEANTDAGSALSGAGKGRVQFSELHYVWPLSERRTLLLGLIDPASSLDTSEIANDETAQFLAAGLVNNPTIGFPDYTLGTVYNHGLAAGNSFTLMLAGSHGLADNPKATYAELFELDKAEKGVFAAAEYQWQWDGLRVVGGLWLNSADHDRLDGSGRTGSNRGLYVSADMRSGDLGWNLRLGLADDRVSQAARFAALAVEYPLSRVVLGAGVAHSWLSDEDATAELDDSTQAEFYARFEVHERLSLSPSVQWLKHPGFDASDSVVDKRVAVYGLRASFTF